ncbi:GTP-binding protein [Pseudomonas aeruginosa]|nr:GTP-binding protein [Pseudomonas aeruginosa]
MTSRTEDEDLAQIKDWWQRNGKPLVTGGILALAVVFGWQAWQKYQTNQAQGASIVYQQLIETALNPTGQPDPAKVAELAGKLKSEFGGNPLCPVRQPVRGQGRGRQRQAG